MYTAARHDRREADLDVCKNKGLVEETDVRANNGV